MELRSDGGSNLGIQQNLEARRTISGIRRNHGLGAWSMFGLVVMLRTRAETGPPIATAEI